MMFFGALVGVAIVIVVAVLGSKNWRKPKLSAAAISKVEERWKHMLGIQDLHRKLLEADNVLDFAFQQLGLKGTLGEKLKKIGKYLPNEDAVWNAHKLRNKIAHETGVNLSSAAVDHALHSIRRTLDMLERK